MDTQQQNFAERLAEVAHHLSEDGFVVVVGPDHSAIEGLTQIAESVSGQRKARWWSLEHRGTDFSSLLTDVSASPEMILMYGLENLNETGRTESLRALSEGLDPSKPLKAGIALWLPRSALSWCQQNHADLLEKADVLLDMADENVVPNPDLENRRRYAAQVVLKLTYWPLHALFHERYLRPLAEFYVEPLVACGEKNLLLGDWIRNVKNGFLEGPAGMGKTQALVAFALELGQYSEDNPAGSRLPMLAAAADIAEMVRTLPDASLSVLCDHGNIVTWDEREALEKWAEEGALYLLVDGLDRVIHQDEQAVVAWLQGVRTRYPGMSIVVSGRSGHQSLDDAERAFLQPFDATQVRTYRENYFRLLEAGGKDEAVSEFDAALARSPYLADLASTPSYLIALCTLQHHQGCIPAVRVRILEFLVEALLSRWEIFRAGPSDGEAPRELIHDEISLLASHVKAGGKTRFDRQQVAEIANRERDSESEVIGESVILRSALRAGLVVEEDAQYLFAHPLFLQYLAAEPFVGDIPSGVERLSQYFDDPEWRDVIVTAVGLAARRYSWKIPQFLESCHPAGEGWDALSPEVRLHRMALILDAILEAQLDADELKTWREKGADLLEALRDEAGPADREALEASISLATARLQELVPEALA